MTRKKVKTFKKPSRRKFYGKVLASLLLAATTTVAGGFLSATGIGAFLGVPLIIAGCIPLANTITHYIRAYEDWHRDAGDMHMPAQVQRPWEN
jgi:low temperature requirement protein LtrA